MDELDEVKIHLLNYMNYYHYVLVLLNMSDSELNEEFFHLNDENHPVGLAFCIKNELRRAYYDLKVIEKLKDNKIQISVLKIFITHIHQKSLFLSNSLKPEFPLEVFLQNPSYYARLLKLRGIAK